MTKTILIPTDLSVASLNTLKIVLERHEAVQPDVILLYAESLSDSISDLLFYSPEKILRSRISAVFTEALEILKNRFEQHPNRIRIELFHGFNSHAMNNFLEAKGIEAIYVPGFYKLKTKGKAFDPTPMLKKSTVPVTEIFWEPTHKEQSERDELMSLFMNNSGNTGK